MADGKDTFELVAGAPKDVMGLSRSGPWLLATTWPANRPVAEQSLIHLSLDGSTWTDVRLP